MKVSDEYLKRLVDKAQQASNMGATLNLEPADALLLVDELRRWRARELIRVEVRHRGGISIDSPGNEANAVSYWRHLRARGESAQLIRVYSRKVKP